MMNIFERYGTDPVFHHLVTTFEKALEMGAYTPTEVREALYLAMVKVEERNPRPIFVGREFDEYQLRRSDDLLRKMISKKQGDSNADTDSNKAQL